MTNALHLTTALRRPRVLLSIFAAAIAVSALVTHFIPAHGPEWPWYEKGMKAFQRGDRSTATADLERAISIRRNFAEAYNVLAIVYMASGKMDRALETLDRLRVLQPGDAFISTRISETYAPIDNVYMIRWAREAILQEPRTPRAHMLLALGLARTGNTRDALAQAQVAEQLSHSSLLRLVIKGNPALGSDPAQLVSVLGPLVRETPYE